LLIGAAVFALHAAICWLLLSKMRVLAVPEAANDEWTAVVLSLRKPIETYEPDVLLILKATDERLGRSRQASAIAARLAALMRS
jgi:hypothetical protein